MITEISEPTDCDRDLTDSRVCGICAGSIAVISHGDRVFYEKFIPYWNVTAHRDDEQLALCEDCAGWVEELCDEHAEPARAAAVALEQENAWLRELGRRVVMDNADFCADADCGCSMGQLRKFLAESPC